MSDNLHALDAELERLLNAVDRPALRKTSRKLAQGLRKRNQQRQAKQQDPDGSAWEPRKAQRQTIAQRKMMLGLRKTQHFTIKQRADAILIGYTGRAARIARVHQFGMRDKPAPKAKPVNYAPRQLLGVTASDQAWIRDQLLQQLAGR